MPIPLSRIRITDWSVIQFQIEVNRAAFRRILEGIGQQVDQGLLEQFLIDRNFHRTRR